MRIAILQGHPATMGMPALVFRWWFGSGGVRVLVQNFLRFVGLRPVRTTFLGMLGTMPPARAAAWLAHMAALGRKAR